MYSMKIEYLIRPGHPKLAYIYTESLPQGKSGEALPPVLFLGGYRSDMTGTKAQSLEEMALLRGQSYIRFDYSGHGLSEGDFESGTIGQWRDDALSILENIVKRKTVIVGSSMGGWMAFLLAQARPDLIHGIVGIAAAPDFTEEIYAYLTPQQKKELHSAGMVHVENDYSNVPYSYTKSFYEEAKAHLVLKQAQAVSFPIALVQGRVDQDVPWQTAERIAGIYKGPDTKIIYIEDGGHRLSRPSDLAVIDAQIRRISGLT